MILRSALRPRQMKSLYSPWSLDRLLQHIAQVWERLLFLVSGGKLNLQKCSWYILRWEWDKGRSILSSIRPTDPEIQLYHGNQVDTKYTIQRQELAKSTRMLGASSIESYGRLRSSQCYIKEEGGCFRFSDTSITSTHSEGYIDFPSDHLHTINEVWSSCGCYQ